MISRECPGVGINAEEFGAAFEFDTGFFIQLACKGALQRLAFLYAAARKMPARAIRVADQEHAVAGIEDAALRSERKSARDAVSIP